MVHVDRYRDHFPVTIRVVFTDGDLGYGIPPAVPSGVAHMAEPDPGQGREMDHVLPYAAADKLVGCPHFDHLLGGLLQKQVQIFEIGNVGESESPVIAIDGG